MKNITQIFLLSCLVFCVDISRAQIEGSNMVLNPQIFVNPDNIGNGVLYGIKAVNPIDLNFNCKGNDTISLNRMTKGNINYEPYCVMSDTSGNILFYVGGSVVYDSSANQTVVYDSGQCNAYLIVPRPMHQNEYYIFYTRYLNSKAGRFVFSQHDILYNVSTRTVLQSDSVDSKWSFCAATKTRDKKSYWVTFADSGLFNFHACVLDSSGFHPNGVISGFPAYNRSDAYRISFSPFSPDATNIFITTIYLQDTNNTVSMDFDNSTGKFSNPKQIITYPKTNPVEDEAGNQMIFSPDGKKLYEVYSNGCTAQCWEDSLFQFDLSSNDPVQIQKSKTLLLISQYATMALFQGPDSKIYVYSYTSPTSGILSTINYPDSLGFNCGLAAGKTYSYARFTYLYGFLTRQGFWPSFTIDTDAYNAFLIHFFYNDPGAANTYKWDFGDGSITGTGSTSMHTYNLGSYKVRLIVTDQYGYDEIFKRNICIDDPFLHLVHDTFFCDGDSVLINSGNPYAHHLWSNGDTADQVYLSKAGKYWIRYTYKNQQITDSFKVKYDYPIMHKFLPNDTTICQNLPLTINLDSIHGTFTWQDWIISKIYTISTAGLYRSALQNDCGKYFDSIKVSTILCPCNLYVPNIFTPDGNNLNDTFKAVCYCSLSSFNLQICTRWGEIVYSGNNINSGWDGNFKGGQAPLGLYIYNAKGMTAGNQPIKASGVFNLLR